jgi:hypothetical protein
VDWLSDRNIDRGKWALLFKESEKLGPDNLYSMIPDLTKDLQFETLHAVAGSPFLILRRRANINQP